MKRVGHGVTTLASVAASTTHINLYERTPHLQTIARPTPEDNAGASNGFAPVLPPLGCHGSGNAYAAVYSLLPAGDHPSDNQRLAHIHASHIRVGPWVGLTNGDAVGERRRR